MIPTALFDSLCHSGESRNPSGGPVTVILPYVVCEESLLDSGFRRNDEMQKSTFREVAQDDQNFRLLI
jgi:hypothetical protein